MSKRVVIIGSGLGGLTCGVVLSKNGYDVTVLEQQRQLGGCLQCFSRRGAKFETGMHFVGSASEGQTLDRLMKYLEIRKDVVLSKLDEDGYEQVHLEGQTFKYANGREAFIEQMGSYFPREKDNIAAYYDLVEKVAGASSLHSLKYAESDAVVSMKYQLSSINSVIDETVRDPMLAKVLVGNLPLYAAEKDKTPFSTHAFITDFYNQSAYRFVGGSDAVARSLVGTIEKYGGRVLSGKKATRVICDSTKATGVEVNGEEVYEADYVISDAHPKRTLELIDSKLIKPAFRQRIDMIPQTVGSFSVYIEFKEGTVPYMNYNYYGYNTDSPWSCENYTEETWPKGFLYMHFCQQEKPAFANTGVILSYMRMEEVGKWIGTQVGHRGADYEALKERKTRALLASLEKHFPGIGACIKNVYSSTPLTYYDYTGAEGGSMYGVAKDISLGMACRVPHKTKIPNLYQTGQNINSHGMLGVIVGTIVTCSEFLTARTIYQQIVESSK
ncbi:MAG: NAD(P)/FAD-dependent oxidoreductase [Bacteroidales bacterium]|nr:NAD(P)/FAD-dependent oxidoreductase [Bacteroidales bacterium]